MTTLSTPARSTKQTGFVVTLLVIDWLIAYNLIQPLANWISYSALRLPHDSRLGESLAFFLYDVPKILLLLSGMIFIISMIRSFFSPERTRALLCGKREGVGNVLAAMLGIVTPFCSCSAVPLFIGFVEAGIPMGVTFAFLISSPMVNEVALVLLWGLFGPGIALLYMAAGLSVAVVGGLVLGRLGVERWVEPWVLEVRAGGGATSIDMQLSLEQRLRDAWTYTRELVRRVIPYVLVGIGVGA